MMSRNAPTNAAPGGGLARGEQRARVQRADVVAQVLLVGQLHDAVVLGHRDRVEAQVHVERDRLAQAGGDGGVVHC